MINVTVDYILTTILNLFFSAIIFIIAVDYTRGFFNGCFLFLLWIFGIWFLGEYIELGDRVFLCCIIVCFSFSIYNVHQNIYASRRLRIRRSRRVCIGTMRIRIIRRRTTIWTLIQDQDNRAYRKMRTVDQERKLAS